MHLREVEQFIADARRLEALGDAEAGASRLRDAANILRNVPSSDTFSPLSQAARLELIAARWMQQNRKRTVGGVDPDARLSPGLDPTQPDSPDNLSAWVISARPNVRFDDVAGLGEAKHQVKLKIIYPFTHPEEAKTYGIAGGGGLLLFGPSGTGKTQMAKAIAGEVNDAAFFHVQGRDILTNQTGTSLDRVRQLFVEVRRYPRAIIFVDELERLFSRRQSSRSPIAKRVVSEFLTEIQGFASSPTPLLIVGATNLPWDLDEAVLRPGRFDERIYVPLPDLDARLQILRLNLHERPVAADVGLEELASRMGGLSGADLENVCRKAAEIPFFESITSGTLRSIECRDFDAVLLGVKPSVSEETVKRYEAFAQLDRGQRA